MFHLSKALLVMLAGLLVISPNRVNSQQHTFELQSSLLSDAGTKTRAKGTGSLSLGTRLKAVTESPQVFSRTRGLLSFL